MGDFILNSYNTGPYGNDLTVDALGNLNVSSTATSGRYSYGEGDTGRTVSVDGCGRLLVNVYTPSGIILPAASGYLFGEQFYVIGSGFYRRGISSWESTGLQGPAGAVGPSGLQGATGATGATGPIGPAGPTSLYSMPFVNLTSASGITVDMRFDGNFYLPLLHNATITPVSGVTGAKQCFVIQQSSGSCTFTFENTYFPAGTAPTATAASGSIDVVGLMWIEQLNKFLGQYDLDWK